MKTTKTAKKPVTKTATKKAAKPNPTATPSAASGYDASLDTVVKDLGTIETGTRAGDLSVRVVAYNGGVPKLLITRCGESKATGQPWFSPKLGRLNAKELDALLPLITKARKYL